MSKPVQGGGSNLRARVICGLKTACWFALLLAGWPAPPLVALELYSVVDAQCRPHTGLIVNVSETDVYLLTLDGKLARLSRSSVSHVLVYNTLDNPISRVETGAGLGDLMREVSLVGDEKITFTGWPIKFFEDLIVFFDNQGNTHIYDIGKILRIAEPRNFEPVIGIVNFKNLNFGFGNFLPECGWEKAAPGPLVLPTRTISDQIKIGKFLADYQNGFENLRRFQSRTVFYARPFLYEKPTIFGVTIAGQGDLAARELPSLLPFHIQWSSGKAYGRQAMFAFGTQRVEILPNAEPVLAVRTEVKAHMFTAAFVGNLFGMAQGGDFIVDYNFFFTSYFSRLAPTGVAVFPHFNQLALTGLEWQEHSISVGLYYPVIGVYGNGIFREVLSPQSSILLRYLYSKEKVRLRFVHSSFRLGSDNPDSNDIRMAPAEDMRRAVFFSPGSAGLEESLENFSLDGGFTRLGFDLDVSADLRIGLDGILFAGDYREQISGVEYQLEFEQVIASFYVTRWFGRRVRLRANLNHFQNSYPSQAAAASGNPKDSGYSLSLEVEFVL